jgi:carbon monoxide dehydrogenase subunit G
VPSQTFTHTSTTRASIAKVWAALNSPGTWEAIGGVDRVFNPKVDGEGRLQGFSFDTVAGGKKYVGTATPHERVEGERMAWDVQTSEVRGVTSVRLDTRNGSTVVTVTLHVESAGLLSSMFFPLIAGAIGNGLSQTVETFVAGFED